MRVHEILVAGFLELRIEAGVDAVAGGLVDTMEVLRIVFEEVIGRQVCPAAEPGVAFDLEIPVIGMHGGHVGVSGMQHERDAAG